MKLRISTRVLCIVTILAAGSIRAAAYQWSLDTVDSSLETGYYVSMAVDADRHPHFSYYNARFENLDYATWSTSLTDWVVTTIDSTQDVGRHSSIALSSAGLPRISYYFFDDRELKFAQMTSRFAGIGTWTNEVVDTTYSVGMWTSLAIASNNRPHIAYYNSTLNDLQYAEWNGVTWDTSSVDTNGFAGEFASMRLDGSNHPMIAYWDRTNDDLKFARWNSGTTAWDLETVDDGDGDEVGRFCSLALDEDGNPWISYYDDTNGDLKLAGWDPDLTEWDIQSVDTNGTVGLYTSLEMEGTAARISYHDSGNQTLKFAAWHETSEKWAVRVVDDDAGVGRYTSLAVDDNGNVHIAYQDYLNGDVEYALGMVPEPTVLLLAFVAGPVAVRRLRR